jgi:hypothetical protein
MDDTSKAGGEVVSSPQAMTRKTSVGVLPSASPSASETRDVSPKSKVDPKIPIEDHDGDGDDEEYDEDGDEEEEVEEEEVEEEEEEDDDDDDEDDDEDEGGNEDESGSETELGKDSRAEGEEAPEPELRAALSPRLLREIRKLIKEECMLSLPW